MKVMPCMASIKIVRVKDPESMEQVLKRRKKEINYGIGVVCALLVISYVMQFTNWLFSREIPLVGISFRTIFTIAAIYYVAINRDKLVAYIRFNQAEMKRRFGLFSELSDSEGMGKLRVLKKHSEEKAKRKEAKLAEFLKL